MIGTDKYNAMKKKTIILAITVALVYLGCRVIFYNEYSNEKAVEYLTANAENHSVKSCALYVRRAIEAGGCPTFLQPPSACDYDKFLPDLGFIQIDAEGYTPQIGDVVVFSAIKGHKNGHICMYNGKQWVSDFKQRSMYSASAYRREGTHTYWRRPDGKAWRKISLWSLRKHVY